MNRFLDKHGQKKLPSMQVSEFRRWPFWVYLSIIFTVGIVARFTYPSSIGEWIDRDIQRTIGLVSGQHIPLVGPELNSGGFLPGPFLYIFQAPVYLFTRSPYAVVYFNKILNIASIFLLFLILYRRYSPVAVLTSVTLVSFSMMHASLFGSPINPSFLFFLNTLIVWFFVKIYIDNRDWYFIPALVLTALGSQIHLSFASYTISLIFLTVFIRRVQFRVVLPSVFFALLTFVPFVVYQFLTKGVSLHRSYQQFSPSKTTVELLPKDVFFKIFCKMPTEVALERIKHILSYINQHLASHITHSQVSGYTWFSTGLEFLIFAFAIVVGIGAFIVWGYRTKCRFSVAQRKLLVPFLSIFPIVMIWQWIGIARHSHHWYSFIFFPLVPLWIGASFEAVFQELKVPSKTTLQAAFLASLFLLSFKPFMFYKTGFFLLDEVVADIRDVKSHLGLPIDRYICDVFFIDRPPSGNPVDTDPPFEYPPWGTYTDYLYQSVTSDIQATEAPRGKCYLLAHKRMVEYYTLDYYLDKIRELYAINPERIFESERFFFFEYSPLPCGNCYHNTINAWVHNERMNNDIAKVSKDRQSALLKEKLERADDGTLIQRSLEFAVFDRKANLPLKVLVLLEKRHTGAVWKVFLDSAQLMAHLNTTPAYSGLYRPWPKLWIDDVRVTLEKYGEASVVSITDREIGQYLLTPLSSRFSHLKTGLDDKNLKLTLSYRTIVTGEYSDVGKDIQDTVTDREKEHAWETSLVLYDQMW